MKYYNPFEQVQTKYLFFTGKGGVGKTSVACATAVSLADSGKKVLLISTDPASNLQDVFSMELDNKGIAIPDVPNLTVANLDPVQAAAEYRESVIAPYRGKLPESVIANMEEQLSGSCTIEIAAFNEFRDLSPMKKFRMSTIISSLILHQQDIRFVCCSCRQPGAASSAKALTERPAWDSFRAWKAKRRFTKKR